MLFFNLKFKDSFNDYLKAIVLSKVSFLYAFLFTKTTSSQFVSILFRVEQITYYANIQIDFHETKTLQKIHFYILIVTNLKSYNCYEKALKNA